LWYFMDNHKNYIMKKHLLLFLAIIPFLTSFSQISYTCNFDSINEQDAWTEYRLGDSDNSHWLFHTSNYLSPHYSLGHDYPMDSGVDSVDDWMVSPPLWMGDFADLTVSVMQSRLSMPPDVYLGLWYSTGSPDPADHDFTELLDLTILPDSQFVYIDTTYQIQTGADTAYIAFRYKADYYAWLMVWIDNLNIIGSYQLDINDNYSLASTEYKIYPNPATDYLHIPNDLKDTFKLEIFDPCGKKVVEYSSNNNESTVIDITPLDSGIYFYCLSSENELLYSDKLVIN